MRQLLPNMVLLGLVLAAPIVPFLIWGAALERASALWLQGEQRPLVVASLVVGLLALDILLPTPSSLISTLAGWQLGSVAGAVCSWLGMTLGATLGFAIARRWGYPLARRLSSPEQLAAMQDVSVRFGPVVLVVARGLPVLAEASVLLVGIHRLSWRRFLLPVALSNLGLSVAYAVLGSYSQEHGWLPLALAISVALPLLLAWAARNWMRKQREKNIEPQPK